MGVASIVIACLALIVSTAVFLRDNHRYRIPLEIRIPYCMVIWNKDNQSLIVFRLMCVNHSLSGQTIVRALITFPTGITESSAVWTHDEDYKNVTAVLPNREKSAPLPISEVLLDALDIPPHQSRNKWVGFYLNLPQKNDESIEKQPFLVSFSVLDVNDKFLAVLQIPMTLHDLRTVGAHQIIEQSVFKKYKVHKNS